MKDKNFKTLIFPFKVKQEQVSEDDNFYSFEGYGSTFGNLDLVGDVVLPGAFSDSLKKRMPKLLWSHNAYQLPLGKFDTAQEDGNGLFMTGRLPKNVTASKDAGELMKMGAIDSMSIGFNIVESDVTSDGVMLLKKVDLWEVSLVNMPANPMASITSVKADQIIDLNFLKNSDVREIERVLRDSGFSNKAAVYMASLVKRQSESVSTFKSNKNDFYHCLAEINKLIKNHNSPGEKNVCRNWSKS